MKTAVVLEIHDNMAVLLPPDGTFIQRPCQPGWQVGDVVPLGADLKKRRNWMVLVAAAACLICLLTAGSVIYSQSYHTQAIISIDVNPSFEIEINQKGQVVDMIAYNDDGSRLLADLSLRWQPYQDALSAIMANQDMQNYLSKNEFLEISVYSATDDPRLLSYVNQLARDVTTQHPQVQAHCTGAGRAFVEEAHRHGMTPGRWRALQELQQADPAVDIADYQDCGVGAIHRRIRECHDGAQSGPHRGRGPGQACSSDLSNQDGGWSSTATGNEGNAAESNDPSTFQTEDAPPSQDRPKDPAYPPGNGRGHGHGRNR